MSWEFRRLGEIRQMRYASRFTICDGPAPNLRGAFTTSLNAALRAGVPVDARVETGAGPAALRACERLREHPSRGFDPGVRYFDLAAEARARAIGHLSEREGIERGRAWPLSLLSRGSVGDISP